MSREIKFRGKRLDDGEWVYGDYWQTVPNHRIITHPPSGDSHAVDPATVGQYTGLTINRDKADICEGDIIELSVGAPWDEEVPISVRLVVSYEYLAWWMRDITSGEHTGFLHELMDENGRVGGRIIGDIHSNPDLLEKP